METFLLDTQVALWLMLGSTKIDEKEFIRRFNPKENRLIYHQVSTWEIQIKYSLGKLPLPKKPEHFLLDGVSESGFQYEKIDDKAIFMLDKLPKIHNDPFDRLLLAHSIVNAWTIISADEKFEEYPIKLERV